MLLGSCRCFFVYSAHLHLRSFASFRAFPMTLVYSASKAAVRSLTQSFATELAKDNITVNAYAPGVVDTSMWEAADKQMRAISGLSKEDSLKNVEGSITLGRMSVPEDVAKMVSFLASEDSNYITGQTMLVDGGIIFS